MKEVDSPYNITYDELINRISADVMSQLMTDGGKGIRSAVYLGLIHYENWKKANSEKGN